VLSADGNTAIVGGASDNSSTGAAWVFKLFKALLRLLLTKLVSEAAVMPCPMLEATSCTNG
jgi:hypothetical protein